ncbi:MAG: STAS domain-containing protein [Planctomycetes bacterium]|nr:STAS domain-containing protein [Planctomycetota bacterium]
MSEIIENAGQTIVTPQENIVCSTAGRFRDELLSLLADGVMDLVIDLSNVEMVDSDGLSAFIAAHKTLKAAGGKLTVCGASRDIAVFFRIMHLDRQFTIKVRRSSNIVTSNVANSDDPIDDDCPTDTENE